MASLRKEQREALAEAFDKKLGGLLTAAQKQAVDKQAEIEKKRAAASDKPKPKK
jgi:hypothetical protein